MSAPVPPLDLEAAESLRLFDLIVREARKPVEAERDALRAAIQAAIETKFYSYETRDAGRCYNAEGVDELLAALAAVVEEAETP